jgi:EAL domain-containing protein (putative c-di-GMP-specific phosphodiesterase class I)
VRGVGLNSNTDAKQGAGLSLIKDPVQRLKKLNELSMMIAGDPDDAVIVDTIIAMARHLGLEVIAEGVETEAELKFLQDHGCGCYQGYYFSKPLPADGFVKFLE